MNPALLESVLSTVAEHANDLWGFKKTRTPGFSPPETLIQ